MRIDEFEFQDRNGNEIEPTKNQLVVYIKSLHKQIAELQKQLEEKEKEVEKIRELRAIKDDASQCVVVNGVKFSYEQILIIQDMNYNYDMKIKNLKQQLKTQPAEIVEKIKEQIFNHFNVKNIEEYERLSLLDALFTADAVAEILDTILKEYQK